MSHRIGRFYSWPLQLKLSLTPSDRVDVDGTHDGEERRERNRNVKVCEDMHDSRREDELITCSSVSIDAYDRLYKVRWKVYRETLHER